MPKIDISKAPKLDPKTDLKKAPAKAEPAKADLIKPVVLKPTLNVMIACCGMLRDHEVFRQINEGIVKQFGELLIEGVLLRPDAIATVPDTPGTRKAIDDGILILNYVESCGHISEDTVKKYIEEQKKN